MSRPHLSIPSSPLERLLDGHTLGSGAIDLYFIIQARRQIVCIRPGRDMHGRGIYKTHGRNGGHGRNVLLINCIRKKGVSKKLLPH